MYYTDEQIQRAFNEKYFPRIERVMEVLRLAPLNESGISVVNHASNDFLITSIITQEQGHGRIETEAMHCRELYLATNPDFPKRGSLVDKFADAPLRIADSPPYCIVAYDSVTFDYVVKDARTEHEFERGRIMRTENDVPFYLAREAHINAVLPFRLRLGSASVAVKR